MHLLFVDDILIFSNGYLRKINVLTELISLYGKDMGMSINTHKSTIYYHNINHEEIRHIAQILPHETKPMEEDLKYLGFHLNPNYYSKEDWLRLISKVKTFEKLISKMDF